MHSEEIKVSGDTKRNGMDDEYDRLDCTGETFVSPGAFMLESGQELIDAEVRYNTYGSLNENKDNVIVVCHALTGNSKLDSWWGAMLGPGQPFDTSKYMVVCANILGSCYGSSGPRSVNPATGKLYGNAFPKVTIRDTVSLHLRMVKEHLGVRSVYCAVGGSMGGMQALEWGLIGADFVKSVIAIGCGGMHTAWQIGISETQRQAIYLDPKWNNGDVDFNDLPTSGLSVARQIAMISYRNFGCYQAKFGREVDAHGNWQVKNYLRYQGEKFLDRFDAVTYVKITEQMDTHDVGRNRGGMAHALSTLMKCRFLVLGIDSDLLYPLEEQRELAALVPHSQIQVINSPNGHDGFLLEQKQVGEYLSSFLKSLEN